MRQDTFPGVPRWKTSPWPTSLTIAIMRVAAHASPPKRRPRPRLATRLLVKVVFVAGRMIMGMSPYCGKVLDGERQILSGD